jgi:hypothetical protein
MRWVKSLLAGITAAVVLASPAQADWYMTSSAARSASRQVVHDKYGMATSDIYVSCRPPGGGHSGTRKRHVWKCYWDDVSFYAAEEDPCDAGETSTGIIQITGAPKKGYFRYRITQGIACRVPYSSGGAEADARRAVGGSCERERDQCTRSQSRRRLVGRHCALDVFGPWDANSGSTTRTMPSADGLVRRRRTVSRRVDR